jgi:predicted secreted protein
MTAKTGRKILITWDDVEIAARTKTITFNGEPLDVSDDRSDGWRELLATEIGESALTISFEGLYKGSTLRLKNNTEAEATISMPGAGVPLGEGDITGMFVLTGFEVTGEYNDAVTFSAELRSSGEIEQDPDEPAPPPP